MMYLCLSSWGPFSEAARTLLGWDLGESLGRGSHLLKSGGGGTSGTQETLRPLTGCSSPITLGVPIPLVPPNLFPALLPACGWV